MEKLFLGSFMNRLEFVDSVARASGLTKAEADRVISAFMDVVASELGKGGEVKLTGFGTFCVVHRNETEGRNMKTGEKVKVPARDAPKFRPGKKLKYAVSKK